MIILVSNLRDAGEIIKNNGFVDLTPEINLFTKKVFEKDGERYRFLGWHKKVGRIGLWKDVEMEKI